MSIFKINVVKSNKNLDLSVSFNKEELEMKKKQAVMVGKVTIQKYCDTALIFKNKFIKVSQEWYEKGKTDAACKLVKLGEKQIKIGNELLKNN